VSPYRLGAESLGFLVCDRGVCLYVDRPAFGVPCRRESPHRCIRHGALLTYVPEYTGLSEGEARKRHRAVRAARAER
jgi:hypothetical protein